jgi:hypothetical protein
MVFPAHHHIHQVIKLVKMFNVSYLVLRISL